MKEDLRIAVITHAIDNFDRGRYVLNALMKHWVQAGATIESTRGPMDPPPEADLAISHIDMTAVGDEYARMFDQYPLVVNGTVRDISKSTFSQEIIGQENRWNGPVIVKTDKNFGGMRELQERFLAGDSTATIGVQRPWRKIEALADYPVFDHPAHVPIGVWRNPALVVEKFRPEAHGDGEYALRMWVFLGDRGVYYQSFANEPIVKGKNTTRRVALEPSEVPQEIQEARARLGFDYGKFDFGIVDGQPVLYDVNRTPGFPRPGAESEKVTGHYPELARGLEYFLRKLQ